MVRVVGYTHRASTRRRARRLAVASAVLDDMTESVSNADLVVLATPICTFEEIFGTIADALPTGSIVTDVGSTKVLPHRWATRRLPKRVHYVGSHPIAGSEQRGLEFARSDLFDQATCVLTATKKTNRQAVRILKRFWSALGCSVKLMSPAQHDRILANVSHLPHVVAVALMNAIGAGELNLAGTGLVDTSRVASGPANIWADVLLTNAGNTAGSIDRTIAELSRLRKAIKNQDDRQIRKLLEAARRKREVLIDCRTARNKPLP
jgi:prephenate dehydrogenase